MALMAYSDSEVYNDKTCSKTCLKNFETLKKQCDDLIVKINQTEFTATTYKRGLATLEEQLITYIKNEVLFSEEVAVLKREVACKDYEINMLKSEFEKVKQEKEGIEFKIEKFDKASKDLDQLLGSQITDKSKKSLGYSAVPPPHPLIYNRPKKLDLSYSGLNEFKELEFKGYGTENNKQESNIVCDKKSDDSKKSSIDSLVKEQVSKDTSSFVESSLNVDKETVFPKNHEKPVRYAEMYRSQTPKGNQRNWNGQKSNQLRSDFVMVTTLIDDKGFVDSGCSRHMTGNIAYLSDFKEFDGGAHGGRIYGKGTLKTDSLDFEDILLKIPRKDNMYSFDMNNIVPKESLTCLVAKATLDESMFWHRRLGHINFKNINKLVKDNLVRGLPTKHFENDQTCVACLKGKQHRASYKSKVPNPITKPLFMLHMDLFGLTFMSSLMHKKYCLVVTDDYSREKGIKREYSGARIIRQKSLGKFDGKSYEGFFVGYSLSSKVFRVHNTRTRRVENLHIGFLENKPMIEDNGPKWMFDIDSLTQSIIYVPVALDASYFDSSSKDVDNDEPKSADDDQKQVEDGLDNENDKKDKYEDDSSPKDVNNCGVQDQDSPKDMFKMGTSHILEATPVEFFKNDRPTSEQGGGGIDPMSIAKALLFILGGKQCRENPVIQTPIRFGYCGFASLKKIEEEVYVCQPSGFEDPEYPDKVYKVVKTLYGLYQAPRAWLTSKKKEDGIFISQDKYVDEILKKFNYTDVKSASTPVDLEKPLVKDRDANDVDEHLYRSMIGSLMYLTASRPDIMFAVCACARFQVTPKTSHLLASALFPLNLSPIIPMDCYFLTWDYPWGRSTVLVE
ncbi:putative ribonuclease H-like domain-containing protein [Tanacetum coccineum]